MRTATLTCLLLLPPALAAAGIQVLFSHQSVGRNIVADPERSAPTYRASHPLRDRLDADIAFWDHDYYNFYYDGVTNAVLTPSGDNYEVVHGFGSHRGSGPTEALLDHLLGAAFTDEVTGAAKAFRDSCTSRFDIVMVKPSFRDMHMNTASSDRAYQSMLIGVSDWWHQYNELHGTNKILVVLSPSSLRHPSDYADDSAGWPDTPAGHAEAETDAAAYWMLDAWLGDVWVHLSPYTRFLSLWSLCVNHWGSATELNFTKDMYTGTGVGDSSGNHHVNTAGSDMLQTTIVSFIHELAAELNSTSIPAGDSPAKGLVLHDAVPNPFNPATVLSFTLASASPVKLSIFDPAGREIAVILDDDVDAGRHKVTWDGRDQAGDLVSSGVYLYRIEAGTVSDTKRLVLLK